MDPSVANELDVLDNAIAVVRSGAELITMTATDAVTVLEEARQRLLSLRAMLDEPPPEPVVPMPSLTLTPGPGSLEVRITHPATIPPELDYLVLAWGTDTGFVGSATFDISSLPPVGTLTGLQPVEHTVQAGYGTRPAAVPPERLTTVQGTPLAPPPEPGTGAWPAASSWADKRAWIERRAGLKANAPARTLLGPSSSAPAGCAWFPTASPPRLDVRDATLLENLEVPGRIYVRAVSGNPPVTLRNVKAHDVFSSEANANRVTLVEDCEFTMPATTVINSNWGQGNLNAMRPGFTVRRTLLRGGADNMQCVGPGLVEDSVLRDMTIDPEFTHNDFVQNYEGEVIFRRCFFRQALTRADESNHVNGIFADRSTIRLEDCDVEVTAPAGTNAWAIHAAKQPATIWVDRCRVRGKVVGDVRMTSTDHANGY